MYSNTNKIQIQFALRLDSLSHSSDPGTETCVFEENNITYCYNYMNQFLLKSLP